jgi:exosortase/archaeosortase
LIFVRDRVCDVVQAAVTVAANCRQILGAFVVDVPIIVVMNLGRAIFAALPVPRNFTAEASGGLGVIRL